MFDSRAVLVGYLVEALSRDSSVGTETRYGLDGPAIEFRWGRGFAHPSTPSLRPTQPPVKWVFPGGKAAGAWC
jgi:hypothetical protein